MFTQPASACNDRMQESSVSSSCREPIKLRFDKKLWKRNFQAEKKLPAALHCTYDQRVPSMIQQILPLHAK